MITAAYAAVALLFAPQTAPQTPAASPGSELTRDLNAGPPRPATYLGPTPTPAPVTPTPAPVTTPPPATATPAPAGPGATTPAPAPARPTVAPPVTPPPVMTPAPTPAPVRPTPAPVVTTPAPVEPPPPPSVPSVTVLDSAARAALPFTVDLPNGFEIVTGRPGPDFKIYTIRRGDQSFAMVYAGPASQFPIYTGQMVEAAGRASVVTTEGNERHAMEHLFQRAAAPREIHVWTMSLEGADRLLAERIAQSVDVR